ncbi:Outer envelope pore protein 16-4, chloroplastic [Fagus crenata]
MLCRFQKQTKIELGRVGPHNDVASRNDSLILVNGLLAGTTVAARTRNWTQVIGMAGLVSVFSAAADYSRSS